MSSNLSINTIDSLSKINASEWNALNTENHPFLSYEFLQGLEEHNCIGQHVGWFAKHIVAFDEDRKLVAAMPCYEKHNSFGEFIFDWQWANAYDQAGVHYYPKLVSAVPFSPVTGQRLLALPQYIENHDIYIIFSEAILKIVEENSYSSAHILFLAEDQKYQFKSDNFSNRLGFQYHWTNKDYKDFDDFLSGFTSKKRRNVKRERRLATEGIELSIEARTGKQISESEWYGIYSCYQNTFNEKGNYPSLTLPFFKHLAETLPDNLVVFIASQNDEVIAASICLKSDSTLYGRYWGCLERFSHLHFELCFYQGIQYCIENNIQSFEPGAQGEHKITRGFLPKATWSSHYIADGRFKSAIDDFLQRERQHYEKTVYEQLCDLSPFKD